MGLSPFIDQNNSGSCSTNAFTCACYHSGLPLHHDTPGVLGCRTNKTSLSLQQPRSGGHDSASVVSSGVKLSRDVL